MSSRFPSGLFLIAAAGLAVLLLAPADPGKPTRSGLAIGDAAPAAANAAPAPRETAVTPVLLANEPSPAPSTPAAAPKATVVASLAPADTTRVEPKPAWVRASGANVRAGPSTSTAKLFVLQRGAKVTITQSTGDWAFVAGPSGESGWVHSRLLSDSPAAAVAATANEPAREVKQEVKREFARVGTTVVLRAGPSRFAPKLFVLRRGERIAVAETRGRWLRVVLESGASAWLDTRDLSR